MCFVFAGRVAVHGANMETEIIGTDSLFDVLNKHGVTRQCHQDFKSR